MSRLFACHLKVDVRHLWFIIYWYTFIGQKSTVEWEFGCLLINLLLSVVCFCGVWLRLFTNFTVHILVAWTVPARKEVLGMPSRPGVNIIVSNRGVLIGEWRFIGSYLSGFDVDVHARASCSLFLLSNQERNVVANGGSGIIKLQILQMVQARHSLPWISNQGRYVWLAYPLLPTYQNHVPTIFE